MVDGGLDLLTRSHSVLLVDWPDRDVPDSLARAGFEVIAQEGPRETDYTSYVLLRGSVEPVGLGRRPSRADIVYAFRPIAELPDIIELALQVEARAVWLQSGLDASGARDRRGCWLPADQASEARAMVEAAGLAYVDAPYIADAARSIAASAG